MTASASFLARACEAIFQSSDWQQCANVLKASAQHWPWTVRLARELESVSKFRYRYERFNHAGHHRGSDRRLPPARRSRLLDARHQLLLRKPSYPSRGSATGRDPWRGSSRSTEREGVGSIRKAGDR